MLAAHPSPELVSVAGVGEQRYARGVRCSGGEALHWIIYAELKKFVERGFGANAWDSLLLAANLGSRTFLPGGEYPDVEAVAIVTAASQVTKKPAQSLLEEFGEFIVPDLAKFYGTLLDPKWRTLETVEHTETMIHAIIRLNDKHAKPPEIRVKRVSSREVEITYASPRRLCGVAKGIVRGLGKLYGEGIAIDERTCMIGGAPSCTISVRVGSSTAARESARASTI